MHKPPEAHMEGLSLKSFQSSTEGPRSSDEYASSMSQSSG